MANRKIEHIRLSNSDELFDVQDILLSGVTEQIEELRNQLTELQAAYDELKEKVENMNYDDKPTGKDDSNDSGITTGAGGTSTNFTGHEG